MRRRNLLAVPALVLGARAEAQSPVRLAWIEPGVPASGVLRLASMRNGLAENGLIEGRD